MSKLKKRKGLTMSKSMTPPSWFGKIIKATEHQNYLNRIFFLFRWYHKLFVEKRCPACQYWKRGIKTISDNREKGFK